MNNIKQLIICVFVATGFMLSGCAVVDTQKDMESGWIGGNFRDSQNASWVQWNEDYAVSVAHLKNIAGQTAYISKDVDVQFLKRSSKRVPRWSEYKLGESVSMTGWPEPYGVEKEVRGEIIDETVVRFASHYAASYPMVTGSIVKGMSGGPVFNSQGEVLGINVGYSLKDARVNGQDTKWSLFLPYLEIKKEWEKFEKIQKTLPNQDKQKRKWFE